jgi:pimeloyl-ACP methyl ester carboxylesterase
MQAATTPTNLTAQNVPTALPPGMTEARGPGGMNIEELGAGPRLILVHGGGACGARAWGHQEPLAERWRLVMPHRPGYGKSPELGREDFDVDAPLIAALLGDGAHLVGHSYGGVVSLLAAAQRPERVRSLVLVEPGATSVARHVPSVAAFEAALQRAIDDNPPTDPERRLRALFAVIEPARVFPSPLPPPLLKAAQRLASMRWPMEAVIPTDALRAAAFPKLIITGGASPAFEAVADVLATAIGAERAIVPGDHATQDQGAPFNDVLERFLARAQGRP